MIARITDRGPYSQPVKQFTFSDRWQGYRCANLKREASMRDPENDRVYWPAVLAVFAVQMVLLIGVVIAVANHSSFATASLPDIEAEHH
jgi:hypothetical protein